jgi:hypothetical protein
LYHGLITTEITTVTPCDTLAVSESGGDSDRERRLAFAIPTIEQDLEDIDTSLLDPADPDERARG